MQSFKDRIVFVTGASSGIGEATSQAFGALGARILMCARRDERLEKLAEKLEYEHKTAVHYFRLDVRDRAGVDTAVAGLPADWKAIDVLVNNAGLIRGLHKLPQGLVDDWEEMLDTNVKGLLYVSRAVIPGMLERGRGTSSISARSPGTRSIPGGTSTAPPSSPSGPWRRA